ncbi:S1/P1 nuclease [Fibrobacterota bacterium]
MARSIGSIFLPQSSKQAGFPKAAAGSINSILNPQSSILLLTLLSLCLHPGKLHAFGKEANIIVATVAQAHLSLRSQEVLLSLFEKKNVLPSLANWADQRGKKRPYTRDWHAVDIQLNESGYDSLTHGKRVNLLIALDNQIKILGHAFTTRPQKKEAVKWIVNLVADLHQPLQVGENHDGHGRKILLEYRGTRTNLHELWENVLITTHYKNTKNLSHEIMGLIDHHANEYDSVGRSNIIDWLNESHQTTRGCYIIEGNMLADTGITAIPASYSPKSLKLLKKQLKLAGLRLARTLNRIFESNLSYQTFKYYWSKHSGVYHLAGCRTAATIKPENLVLADLAPPNKSLHRECGLLQPSSE